MNDRDIEDTRQPPDPQEGVTCVICKDDFPVDAAIIITGYRREELSFCDCCIDKINLEVKARDNYLRYWNP